MNISHILKAKHITRSYLSTTFDSRLFDHLKAEATSKYENCVFVVSFNLANKMLPNFSTSERGNSSNDNFFHYMQVTYDPQHIKENILGFIFDCPVIASSDIPNNIVVAVGYDETFSSFTTRMRIITDRG